MLQHHSCFNSTWTIVGVEVRNMECRGGSIRAKPSTAGINVPSDLEPQPGSPHKQSVAEGLILTVRSSRTPELLVPTSSD